MDMDTYLRFALSLALILGLILAMAALLRRIGSHGGFGGASRGRRRRVGVVEAAMVDTRRRLVLVWRDDREYLLLIGGANDLVIDANIVRPDPEAPSRTDRESDPDPAPAAPGAPRAAGPSFRALLGGWREGPS